jgi:hypothetical protein
VVHGDAELVFDGVYRIEGGVAKKCFPYVVPDVFRGGRRIGLQGFQHHIFGDVQHPKAVAGGAVINDLRRVAGLFGLSVLAENYAARADKGPVAYAKLRPLVPLLVNAQACLLALPTIHSDNLSYHSPVKGAIMHILIS